MPENTENSELDDNELKEALEKFRLQHPDIRCMSISTVRDTRFRLPEANQVAPFFCPDIKVNGIYDQPHQNNLEHTERLKERGLLVPNQELAVKWLDKVGYYRLKGYGLLFRQRGEGGVLCEEYTESTCFQNVIDLYEFDRHLRLLLLDGIERVEIAFRTRLIDSLCEKYGAHCLLKTELFSDKKNKAGLPIFNHEKFVEGTYRDAKRNKDSRPIKHYYSNYGDPVLPPAWMLSEVLSMGTWSKVYASLQLRADQKPVSDYFRTSPKELESWIHVITNLRNACAHHHRLFDKRCITNPSSKGNLKPYLGRDERDKLFAQVVALFYCLVVIDPETKFAEKLEDLMKSNASPVFEAMGFKAYVKGVRPLIEVCKRGQTSYRGSVKGVRPLIEEVS